jgi:hypothetical protein
MLIDLIIGFFGAHAIVGGGTSLEKTYHKAKRETNGRATFEKNKIDIDPETGDYTSRYDGLRHDKYGCVKWHK